jgi:hypothetical protein
MKQHLLRGRGVPDLVPTSYSQFYLDLDTGLHWVSVGIDTGDDWVGPLATEGMIDNAIQEFSEGVEDVGTKVVDSIEVVDIPDRGRYASTLLYMPVSLS